MIYLDHAAATPLSEKAMAAMRPYLSEQFFNPSAAYLAAVRVRHAYERAKDDIAHVIGAKGADLIMTSGATEATNLAFSLVSSNANAEVLVSAIEHASVLENAKRCAKAKTIAVDENGRLKIEDFRAQLSPRTQFVSVSLVSGELGTIQPIAEIAQIVNSERERRKLAGESTPLYLHCDASQGLGLMEVKVNRLGVDLLTLNAAKVYGPKGVGALYVGHNVRLQPQVVGGGQEMGLRSGTENVAGTIAFATAITEAEKHISSERKRLEKVRQIMRRELEDIPGLRFLGNSKNQLVNFLPISIVGVDAERVVFALEDREIYLSTGAACAASKGIKSPTLVAIGLNDIEIAGSLRITLGRLNDENNALEAAKNIKEVILSELLRR